MKDRDQGGQYPDRAFRRQGRVLVAAVMTSLTCCGGGSPEGSPAEPGRDAASEDCPQAPADTCAPAAVPACVKAKFQLSSFYVKYTDYRGLPIISSAKPSDAALCEARRIVGEMFAERPALIGRMIEHRIRLAIMATTEVTTDIPEHSDLTPKDYWDQRARGLGATLARPAVSAAEENLLCDPSDRYLGENILIHEFSHGIFNIAIDLYEPATKGRLDQAYAAAIAAGRFANTYAATNRDEYWAEGAQGWFDANLSAIPSNGIHNEIHTRAQLVTYDPELAALETEVFGQRAWRYACP